jgi:hypothetical protein
MSGMTTDDALGRLLTRLLPCHGGKGTLRNLWNLAKEDSQLHYDMILFIRAQEREIETLKFKLSHFEVDHAHR